MQEPGAYTAQIDRSFRVPRPLHRSSRGQPNITNRPGESAVLLPFAVQPSYSHASLPASWVHHADGGCRGSFSLEMHA